MKSLRFVLPLLLATLPALAAESTLLDYGRFGRVTVTRPESMPSGVALLLSGGRDVSALHQALSAQGALVIEADGRRLLERARPDKPEDCAYLAYDFEALSKYVQKSQGLDDYLPPVLIGLDDDAALAYGMLAQAPVNTFRGAISLGFCPQRPLPYALCGGDQGAPSQAAADGARLRPLAMLRNPWRVLQELDADCPTPWVASFTAAVPGARWSFVPKGQTVPALVQIYQQLRMAQPSAQALDDLPLIELPAQRQAGDTLAVILSGDGGWAAIDRELGEYLVQQGVAVVGFNSLKYLWKARTPEAAAQALERILTYYLPAWGKQRVLLIGYSLGADILPFMARRLPTAQRQQVALVALLAASQRVEFEFHPWDWISDDDSANPEALPVKPEVDGLGDIKVLCLYGEDERATSLCPTLTAGGRLVVTGLPGGHHFDGDYRKLAELIMEAAR
ncbi:MAG TPA: AcvB/VirJ family lysyl-phosphatidylglycerol hydrolase [Candidatus Competibacteraceae bacterium]|nr:AcvB/VirJ family lysyl-phosphatidylglycerol hydrolase [Candidatus Competibacteraceae bacterium]